MLYPLTFHPIFKERVWGGRNLERVFQKNLPPSVGPAVAKAADNIRFHAEFKARALPEIEGDIKAVEQDILKLLKEVAG